MKKFFAIFLVLLLTFIPVLAEEIQIEYLVPPSLDYDDFHPVNLQIVKKNGKYGYLDENFKEILPCCYHSLTKVSDDLFIVCYEFGEKYGVIDRNRDVRIPFEYDRIFDFGNLFAAKYNGKWGFLDENNNVIVDFSYDWISDFGGELIPASMNGKYGFVNYKAEPVIPFIYDDVDGFEDSLARVEMDGQWAYIDKTGKQISAWFDEKLYFCDNRAVICENGKYGYVDLSGEKVVDCIYTSAESFHEGIAGVEKDGKYGCIDVNGNVVIPFIYDSRILFFNGIADVVKDGKWGYINKQNEIVFPFIYELAMYDDDNVYIVRNDEGKYGCADENGNLIIPFVYDGFHGFYDGLSRVQRGEKWGFVDLTGREVVPCIYDLTHNFEKGRALVLSDGLWGVIQIKDYKVPFTIYVNNAEIDFENELIMKNDRILAPMDELSECLGISANYIEDEKTIQLRKEDSSELQLKLDHPDAILNGTAVSTDATSCIINDVVYLPVRFVAEAFGAHVKWEQDTKSVIISTSI